MLLEKLYISVINGDVKAAKTYAMEAVNRNLESEALSKTLMAIQKLGKAFEEERIFLPELLIAVEAYYACYEILVKAILKKKPKMLKPKGTVVIGTVQGDIHDIGKNLVAMMFKMRGYKVHDLGKDVPPEQFAIAAREKNADIVASSALLTTTKMVQKEIEEELTKIGIRNKVKTLIGGAATSPEWARKIKADGWAQNALDAVKIADKLLNA